MVHRKCIHSKHWPILFLLLSSCAPLQYQDIHTGVFYKDIHREELSHGREIVISDRNVGAKRAGGKGRYLTWEQAIKACPKGYHLLTYNEMMDITVDKKLNLSTKSIESVLHMGAHGFRPHRQAVADEGVCGYYHLADMYDPDRHASWYFNFDRDAQELGFSVNYIINKDRMSVRCVKDFPAK